VNGRIRARRTGWRVSYRAHLVALVVLDGLRYVLTAATLLTHRAHTAVASHGSVVADVIDEGRTWHDHTDLDQARYARLVDQLLFNVDTDPKENR
jgi:hypothetical protein